MRFLIIGLDGATWKVIDPLLAAGKLPNLARLIEHGARCKLSAFEPVLSPIIWTSIASGKLPEKHGITHFLGTANSVKCKRIWDILERPDQPAGVFAWPVTWPPRPVNGFMIPSLFARANDTFPAELQFVKELEGGIDKTWRERLGLVSDAMRHGLRLPTVMNIASYTMGTKLGRYNGFDSFTKPRFIKRDIHLDIYTWLIKRYKPYFTSFYLNQIDAFSHKFWHCYEPDLFPEAKAEEIEQYGDMIPFIYQFCDEAVGQLLKLTNENTLVIVLSDHGFEAAQTARQRDGTTIRVLGNKLLKALNLESLVNYVNHRGTLVLKILRQRQDVLDLLDSVWVVEMDRPLLIMREEDTGEVLVKVRKSRDYRNVDLNKLNVVWPGGEIPLIELVEMNYSSQSGVHHPDGIAIFHGPGVQPGTHVENGSVLDITPTALALLGMPVGRDMDGKVLTEAISPGFLSEVPITYTETYDTDFVVNDAEDDEPIPEALMTRLRDLGYVE